jgi:hypothetical protein
MSVESMLADALRYYAEGRYMVQRQGWDHVWRRMTENWARGDVDETYAAYQEVDGFLRRLARREATVSTSADLLAAERAAGYAEGARAVRDLWEKAHGDSEEAITRSYELARLKAEEEDFHGLVATLPECAWSGHLMSEWLIVDYAHPQWQTKRRCLREKCDHYEVRLV